MPSGTQKIGLDKQRIQSYIGNMKKYKLYLVRLGCGCTQFRFSNPAETEQFLDKIDKTENTIHSVIGFNNAVYGDMGMIVREKEKLKVKF